MTREQHNEAIRDAIQSFNDALITGMGPKPHVLAVLRNMECVADKANEIRNRVLDAMRALSSTIPGAEPVPPEPRDGIRDLWPDAMYQG